ncbi:MAG: SOS response-associated peptidase [Proteobacteria bacterium]|nr:SOS response-associated peptidase [Pseudomonadota bacterium]MBU0965389.1 SOS response-associated peptidase [Pseudomonadota bacterium]
MCGRFALPTFEGLASHFRLQSAPALAPRYNITPGTDIAVVRLISDAHDRELVLLRWGLVPYWAKDKKIGCKLVNARAESVADKPAFRDAFRQRRCLIPALGFYEWLAKARQPYFVRLKESGILAFAGLWDRWRGENNETIESCAIITTGANLMVGRIHDRMPAIIEPAHYDRWLDQKSDRASLPALLKPFPDSKMVVYPVGMGVNNPKNDSPDCLAGIKDN